MSILNAENITHSFGGRQILEDASFRLLKGEHIGLIGANGLGLSHIGLDKDVSELSGGQRAKVLLAKVLLENPMILILDEPTNHLDIAAKEELSRAIKEFRGTVLLVCHESEFYTGVVDEVSWSTKIV